MEFKWIILFGIVCGFVEDGSINSERYFYPIDFEKVGLKSPVQDGKVVRVTFEYVDEPEVEDA